MVNLRFEQFRQAPGAIDTLEEYYVDIGEQERVVNSRSADNDRNHIYDVVTINIAVCLDFDHSETSRPT
jgi:hypothetical protein